jgi:tetratricopeptide (TPR) repeat protein
MNQPHDPEVTTDLPSPPTPSPSAGDPLPATVDDPGSASTDGTRPGVETPDRDLPEVPGYRVLREIARGGMGRVLAAIDLGLDRDVALKVLLPGASIDRFVRESKITARLPHPGIPPVHALGTLDDGSPFLAMKLVVGQTLAAELKTADRPRLLNAFTQVCQAVGFAHSRGVVHRDLKPSNVMVGAFGEVQVMDWGLAKDMTGQDAAEKPRSPELPASPGVGPDANQTIDHRAPDESKDQWTRAGQVLGTPRYMAPEQARGEATDARADVFALGGILCAILTGQPPYRGTSTPEVVRRAAAGDLTEANERLHGCGADAELVALCRRCLSPSPADRPANGQAVADGLTAYLNGVRERLQTAERERAVAAAKAVEDARRRKALMVAASLIVLALLVGITGTTIGLLRAREQRNLVEERNGQLTTANANTEVERDRAMVNLNSLIEAFYHVARRISLLESGQSNSSVADQERRDVLNRVRQQLDQLRESRPDDMILQEQTAELHRIAGNVARSRNEYPAALAAYAASIRISEDLIARPPNDRRDRNMLALALALSDRAGVELLTGKLDESAATLDRAMKLAEPQQGVIGNAHHRRSIALIVMDQAELAHTMGRFDHAAQLAARCAELLDQLKQAPDPEKLPLDPMFAAMAVHRVALAQRELGNTGKALAAHDEAVARMKSLAGPKANRDERYWDCEVRRERARTAVAVPERRAAALADLAELIPIAEKLIEENPHLYFYKAGLASTHLYRGELLLALDQPNEATDELTKSLAVSRVLIDRHGVLTKSMLVRGKTFLAIGRARAAAGKPDEALAHWKNAAKVFELALRIDKDNFHHRRGLAEAQMLMNPPAK